MSDIRDKEVCVFVYSYTRWKAHPERFNGTVEQTVFNHLAFANLA